MQEVILWILVGMSREICRNAAQSNAWHVVRDTIWVQHMNLYCMACAAERGEEFPSFRFIDLTFVKPGWWEQNRHLLSPKHS